MLQEKLFLYFLVQLGGQNFYVDQNGVIKTVNMASGIPTFLPQSPEGWFDNTLSFARNTRYYGLNRSFTIPLKFVGDGAEILRNLFYSGHGVEQQIELDVLKWNPSTEIYELYYKGLIDFTQMQDIANDGIVVGVMQGGIIQLIKAYENVIFQIPCDGSIPENIVVRVDGTLFDDVFHYNMVPQIFPRVPHNDNGLLESMVPGIFFTTNDGDNIGIAHGDPSFEDIGQTFLTTINTYLANSGNWLFFSEQTIDVIISGKVVVSAITDAAEAGFSIKAATSGGYSLISDIPNLLDNSGVAKNYPQTFNFSKKITIPANQRLFIFFSISELTTLHLISGKIDISFSSKYKSSNIWGITLYDLFKLIIKQINKLSSNTFITYNYGADSQLLQQFLNLVAVSGDSIRASTDDEYPKYFNPTIATGSNINQFFSYGPQLKTSLADLFDTANAILNASLSNQFLPAETVESVFLERKDYVFNPTQVPGEFLDLGEVYDFRISIPLDWYWNILEIGYAPQSYDEKAGKFEYNTTLKMTAPAKAIGKTLSLLSKYRADSYGIEYTRFNTAGGKSTTYNNSDNSVFILNRKLDSITYDSFEASNLPPEGGNSNVALLLGRFEQGIDMPFLTGVLMSYKTDGRIYIINQLLSAVSLSTFINITGTAFGRIGDSVIFNVWLNGFIINTTTVLITSASTPFARALTAVPAYNEGDVLFITATTSATASVIISAANITITNYARMENLSSLNIGAGVMQELLLLDVVTDLRPGGPFPYLPISFGFPYFYFNSILVQPNFNLVATINGSIIGSGDLVIKVFVNGQVVITFLQAATGVLSSFAFLQAINRDFNYGDVVWFTASTDAGTTVVITSADLNLVSTQIKVYDLNREVYDTSRGLPHIETNYNIPDLTPKRMLLRNASFLHAALAQLNDLEIIFNLLDKNEFLSTTVGGITITESDNINIGDLDAPLFIPLLMEFNTKVDLNFAQLLNYAANGHVQFTWNGIIYWGFPVEVSQKPELNESQNWKLLVSPVNDLAKFIDLNYTGLNNIFNS